MFLNKLDRPGASFRASLQSILAHKLHPKPLPIVLPVASFNPDDYAKAEPGVQGLVDLVKWELWKWEGGNKTRHPLPRTIHELETTTLLPSSHPILKEIVAARTALLENLSMFSEPLMEKLLDLPSGPSSYLGVHHSEIMPHLRDSTIRNDVLPVLCGSAMQHIGTDLVLDYAGELLADPLSLTTLTDPRSGPLRLLAWKVVWDKRRGWMTFVRIYSGKTVMLLRQHLLNLSQEHFANSRPSTTHQETRKRKCLKSCCCTPPRLRRSTNCHLVLSV
jgi:elongation factor G